LFLLFPSSLSSSSCNVTSAPLFGGALRSLKTSRHYNYNLRGLHENSPVG
jgi:hypothetical protein